jgi:hypothetical protein
MSGAGSKKGKGERAPLMKKRSVASVHAGVKEVSRVAVCMDYDGCGDLLCYSLLTSGGSSDKEKRRGFKRNFEARLEKDTDGKPVTFYNGSTRQNSYLDGLNARNGNGYCRENYPRLCRERGWEDKSLFGWGQERTGHAKYDFIQAQIDDFYASYGGEANGFPSLDFFVYDDDPVRRGFMGGSVKNLIFKDLKRHLKVPEGMTVHLVEFRWQTKSDNPLRDFATLTDETQKSCCLCM